MFLSADQHQKPEALIFEANGNGGYRVTDEDDTSTAVESSVPTHPLGIKPLGNKYFHTGTDARVNLGDLQVLPDEMLAQLLEYLDKRTLRLLGYACKFLYAQCSYDDLWKTIFLESEFKNKTSFQWQGSWRATVLGLSPDKRIKIDCSNVFSDVLHRPFVCSHISLPKYTRNIPPANKIPSIDDLTYDEFADKWSKKPFILTRCIKSWPVLKSWNMDKLHEMYSDVVFRAEAVDWSFATYYQYMMDSQEESPLYLFDKKFVEKMNIEVGKTKDAVYWNPDCFGKDLFELLGAERPAHRWMIIGPERSGSTFHKDPNATSAWNAVIQGAKYWIMFPPSAQVPGVYVSEDQSEVTSPLSIAEWLLEFHAEARRLPECREGICHAGEILHVPSGWWHLVVNIEPGIALTQNFVPKAHLSDVLSFLKYKADQISGFKKEVEDPYTLFVERLRVEYPELLEEAVKQMEEKQGNKKRRWDQVVGHDSTDGGPEHKKGGGFSFGFGLGDDIEGEEDEIP
ncbi:Clavaminate synthase-like protein [Neurospora crassa]|uniref:F-box domain-containing protein n=1 Tax=Neurospora crassa (strain ATCC 24698 / 74-OR23-1A / CBS 708.71 / DSM 1257 / FGSC 987) TaxID=367110 RepID=Q7S1F4_NEUCR|nr:F-box domain-containing protein [Neurospora crassa OR74A]EAA29184.1 F-box domain-containing protein [Neurospora crassa OR74A]KHE82604.1 Clavaminate synthase-like protein [Neurospora crassa]|eukprot:XP_958420.1 F-box domain-containing protein [Neurospora crassa OR74A]